MFICAQFLLRWSIVSILILLCQGFVFEENVISSIFEVMIVFMICTAILCTIWSFVRKKLRLKKTLQVTRQSLNIFQKEDIVELFVMSSIHQFEIQGGILDFKVSDLARCLKRDVLRNILEFESWSVQGKSNVQAVLAMIPISPPPESVQEILNEKLPTYNANINPSSRDVRVSTQSVKSHIGIAPTEVVLSPTQSRFQLHSPPTPQTAASSEF
jgi:hypothetical protein